MIWVEPLKSFLGYGLQYVTFVSRFSPFLSFQSPLFWKLKMRLKTVGWNCFLTKTTSAPTRGSSLTDKLADKLKRHACLSSIQQEITVEIFISSVSKNSKLNSSELPFNSSLWGRHFTTKNIEFFPT